MLKSHCRSFGWRLLASLSSFLVIAMTFARPGTSNGIVMAQDAEPQFTTEFQLEGCRFRTRGANPYVILKPGYQLVLEGEDNGETSRIVITVLPQTERISLPDIGRVTARVVEERAFVNGELEEISRNLFALCGKTNDVFYFGEEVDIFHPDGPITHEGAWRAGAPDDEGLAKPGMIMPGTFLLGARYFQEQADGIALDRAEHVEMGLEVTTEAGTFDQCVKVLETTLLEPGAESVKVYCPGVGLVVDNEVELVEFGFDISGAND